MGARSRNLLGRGCFIPLALLVGCTGTLANNGSVSDASSPSDTADAALVVDAPPLDVADVADVAPPLDTPPALDDAGCWAGSLTPVVNGRPLRSATGLAASGQRYALLATYGEGNYLVMLDEQARVVGEPRRVEGAPRVVSFDDGFGLVSETGVEPVDLTGAPTGTRIAVRLDPWSVKRIGDTVVGLRPIETDGATPRYALVQMPSHGRGPVTETGVVSPEGWQVTGVGVSRMLLRRVASDGTGLTQLALATTSGLTPYPDVRDELVVVNDSLWIPERDEWMLVGASRVPGGLLHDYILRFWRVSASGQVTSGGFGQDHGYVLNRLVRGRDGAFAAFAVETLGARLTALYEPNGRRATHPDIRWSDFYGAWSPQMDRYVLAHTPATRETDGVLGLRCFPSR